MISAWLIGCNASPSGNVVQKNPVPPLKKKHFEVCTSSFGTVRPLITGRNRFAGRKNLSNTGDTPPFRNGEILALVTTRHVFSVSYRRKVSTPLPISRPNSAPTGAEIVVLQLASQPSPHFPAASAPISSRGAGGRWAHLSRGLDG